jgi:hypothetical protein
MIRIVRFHLRTNNMMIRRVTLFVPAMALAFVVTVPQRAESHNALPVPEQSNADASAKNPKDKTASSGIDAHRAPVKVSRFDKPPVIDGRLDEEVWQRAGVLRDFFQTEPGDNVKPPHPTEVRIGYDARFVYIGIHAGDQQGQVRSTVARRDDLSSNDYVAVWLDTFNDRRRAYVLQFNPVGAQSDGVFTEGQGIDFSVDVVMQSQGRLTADGFTVEVAIPFSSLRYEAGPGKLWGIHVLRTVRHLDEWDSWMPLRRESRDFQTSTFTQFLEQEGHLAGIEDVGGERTIELIPTVTVSETGARTRTVPLTANDDPGHFVNRPAHLDPGLTAKLSLSGGVTLNATVNPDFAQVEADQLVVTANQRFPVFFPEKRPFFLEGVEIFQTPIKAVHTRTIVDPDVAVKLTGKRGRNTFGLMLADDNAPGNFSDEEKNDPAIRPDIERFIGKNALVGVVRIKRDVGKGSTIGLLATAYSFIEKHNYLAGVDGRITPNPQTVFQFQLLGTTTRSFFYDPDLDRNVYRSGNGLAYSALAQRNTRHWNFFLSGRGYSPDYRADAGFTTQTNTNPWQLDITYNSEPKPAARLTSWSVTSSTRMQFTWQARMQYGFEAARSQLNFKKQTTLKLDIYRDYWRLFEEEFGPRRNANQPGAFIGAPERSTFYDGFTFQFATAPSQKYSVNIVWDRSWRAYDFDFGAGPRYPRVSPAALIDPNARLDPGLGDTQDISATMVWQPTNALRSTLDFVSSSLRRRDTNRIAYRQKLYSSRTTYQFTKFTFARGRLDYDTLAGKVSGQFLFGWTPNPGTAFYVGYNDDLNWRGFNPFTGHYEPGFRRNEQTFFIKMSYLFRKKI